jgi:hypothetical protein
LADLAEAAIAGGAAAFAAACGWAMKFSPHDLQRTFFPWTSGGPLSCFLHFGQTTVIVSAINGSFLRLMVEFTTRLPHTVG